MVREYLLREMQDSTQKLVLAAEVLALSYLQLFSKDTEKTALSDKGKEQEQKLEGLKEEFRRNYPRLLR